MLKKAVATLLACALLAGVFLAAHPARAAADNDPYEPNNRRANATPITYGASITGLIDPAGDVDVFSFHGTAGEVLRASAGPGGGDTPADPALELMRADGTILIHEDYGLDFDPTATFEYRLPATGKYYLRVLESQHPGVGGPDYDYDLSLSLSERPETHIYVTTTAAGTVASISFDKRDILEWNGGVWSRFFDGSQKGLPTKADFSAIDVADPHTGSIVAAFITPVTLPGVGSVSPFDLALYDGSSWSMHFDGSDVGLGQSGEKIDALEVLDSESGVTQPSGLSCLKVLWLSTIGTGQVMDYQGQALKFTRQDILGFCVTQFGSQTQGKWFWVQDSTAGKGNVNGVTVSDSFTPSMTTNSPFTINGVAVGRSMIYSRMLTDWSGGQPIGPISGPYWRAADAGLTVNTDGIDIIGWGPGHVP